MDVCGITYWFVRSYIQSVEWKNLSGPRVARPDKNPSRGDKDAPPSIRELATNEKYIPKI